MAPRTTGAIALNSVGNTKGDYYFLKFGDRSQDISTPMDGSPHATFSDPTSTSPRPERQDAAPSTTVLDF